MRLFRLIIYVENKENLTYIASTKKTRNTRTTGAIVSRGHKYFAHTHTHTHTHTHLWWFVGTGSQTDSTGTT